MGEGERAEGWRGARVIRAVSFVVCVIALAGCGQASPEEASRDPREVVGTYANVDRSDEAPTLGGYMRYGLPFETNSWNPGLGQWEAHSMQVARAIFDPLFEYDDAGVPRPYLLERADHNADYTEWTMVLRAGVKFHNGKPVTAQDIARTQVSYMNSPVYSSAWAINDLTGATIRDERTLVVRSAKPWVTLPHQSASQLGFLPDPDWLSSDDFGHPIGSGPFIVDHWNVGERIVLRKNPDYWRTDEWGNRLPYLEKVDFDVVSDDATRFELLRRGSLDVMMQTAPGPVATRLLRSARDGEVQLVTDDRGETPEDLVLLNTRHPRLADVNLRRALAFAIDREAFARDLTDGVSPPADGWFEPTSPWYVPPGYPEFDPERARSMLSSMKQPLNFTLKGPDTPEAIRAMYFIKEQWAKVGVNVSVVGVKLSQMLITMMTGDFDALLYQRFDYPNPATELVLVNPAQARPLGEFTLSFSRVTDDAMGEAVDDFLHSTDDATRKDAMAVIQRRLGELTPFLWLAHARRHIVARRGVVNLVHRTLPDGSKGLDFLIGSHRIDQVWLRPA